MDYLKHYKYREICEGKMNIKRVDLVFENCEVVSLNNDMFKYLIIRGITEQKTINCYQYEDGENQVNKCCEYMSIDINKKGYKQKMNWQDITLITRLMLCNDITSICLIYEDDTEEEILVSWNKDNECSNKYQKILQVDEENIRIVIERE